MPVEDLRELPDFRPITLADKRMIDDLFGRYPTEISERTFGSIFIWRNYGARSRLSEVDNHLIVSWSRAKFGRLLLPPVGPDVVRAVHALIDLGYFGQSRFAGVTGLTDPTVSALKATGKVPLSMRDEWDYVYRVEDLARLEGPNYHTQRKELRKATAQFKIEYEPMTKDHQKACLGLEETWCDVKHCTLDELSAAEDNALKEALEHIDDLGFFGGVALIDGRIQALTLGERLNSSTAVVHFEKANPAIRGLYQFINQQFCMDALKEFEFVNREQDVGEPGLRRAKEGYHPHHFVEKHLLLLGGSA